MSRLQTLSRSCFSFHKSCLVGESKWPFMRHCLNVWGNWPCCCIGLICGCLWRCSCFWFDMWMLGGYWPYCIVSSNKNTCKEEEGGIIQSEHGHGNYAHYGHPHLNFIRLVISLQSVLYTNFSQAADSLYCVKSSVLWTSREVVTCHLCVSLTTVLQ